MGEWSELGRCVTIARRPLRFLKCPRVSYWLEVVTEVEVVK
jgi:hypothetical protein